MDRLQGGGVAVAQHPPPLLQVLAAKRLGLGVTTLGDVDQRDVVQRRLRGRVVGAQRALLDVEQPPEYPFRLVVAALLVVEHPGLLHDHARRERIFTDRGNRRVERLAVERLGLVGPTAGVEQTRQGRHGEQGQPVVLPQHAAATLERLDVERLGLVVASLSDVQGGQRLFIANRASAGWSGAPVGSSCASPARRRKSSLGLFVAALALVQSDRHALLHRAPASPDHPSPQQACAELPGRPGVVEIRGLLERELVRKGPGDSTAPPGRPSGQLSCVDVVPAQGLLSRAQGARDQGFSLVQ